MLLIKVNYILSVKAFSWFQVTVLPLAPLALWEGKGAHDAPFPHATLLLVSSFYNKINLLLYKRADLHNVTVSESGIIVILWGTSPIARLWPWSGQNPSGGGAEIYGAQLPPATLHVSIFSIFYKTNL